MTRCFDANKGAVAVITVLVLVQVRVLLLRPVSGDYSSYALPAANWVMTGRLATPQLGSQFDLNKEWRFNSPLIGAGPAPFFWAGEIGQDWYLIGCALQMAIGVVGFLILVRRALARQSWLMVAVVTFALLTERRYLSELVNQRYTIVAYVALAALYFPVRRIGVRAPWWQWWLAGLLPLIHPALLVGSVVWVLAEVATVIRGWSSTAGAFSLVGFVVGVVLTYAWYLDPHPLRTQFIPHLTSREFVPFSGWAQPASWKYALPSQLTTAVVVLAVVLGCAVGRPYERGRSTLRRVTTLVVVVVALDARGNMFYLSYFLLGVAPAALASLAGTPWQRWVALIWCGLAITQFAVELKLTPRPVWPVTRSAARDFLTKHTRSGDVIAVGPPFTLAAAEPDLPNARRIMYVVPMPLYLKDFDVDLFLAEIRGRCTVYVGSPCHFAGVQNEYKQTSPPVFSCADIEPLTFQRMSVIVARTKPPEEIR